MKEDQRENCPVCGTLFDQSRPCQSCGFDRGLWYERYATLSPASGVESLRARRNEWRKLDRQRLKCPKCGGFRFSVLLERECLRCDDCGSSLGQEKLIALLPPGRLAEIRKINRDTALRDKNGPVWEEDPEHCRIRMLRNQKTLIGYTGSCSELILPKDISVIAARALEGCISLRQIQLPEGLEEIGEAAFSCCRTLQKIRIPPGVPYLRTNTFARCSQLEEVVLSEGLRRVEDNAFFCCNSLRELRIPDSLESFTKNAFRWTRRDFRLIASAQWLRQHMHALEQAEVSYQEG